jgi:uncharacterized protein (TIGR02466 family)
MNTAGHARVIAEPFTALKQMVSRRLSPRTKARIKNLLILDVTDASRSAYTNIFTTPLIMHLLQDGPELNDLLRSRIMAHAAENPGVVKSNHGGWHSETGQLDFCGNAGRRLIRHIFAVVNDATKRLQEENGQQSQPVKWTFEAWANVNRNGEFNKVHVHPGSTWSGTYYVDAGDPIDPEKSTLLHLIDPCQGRSTTFLPHLSKSSIYINPRPGLIVLFPSYLPHTVFPHNGHGALISIAFNLRHEPFP